MSRLILLGAGGHGKVVADSAHAMQKWESIEFLDDKHPALSNVYSWQVIGKIEEYTKFLDENTDFGVAIGQNSLRLELIKLLLQFEASLPVVVQPTAYVSESISLGEASVVMGQAAINIGSNVGMGCIINTGAIVEHDCVLQDGVHISSGSQLAGGVKVGARSFVGAGATVKPTITIGDDVVVGAGAVVINNIEDGLTVVGNPAKPI